MKNKCFQIQLGLFIALSLTVTCCNNIRPGPSKEMINEINLKRGEVIYCGPKEHEFGSLEFKTSCSDKIKPDFDLAIELLHSFEYDEAEKMFAKIIDREPACAMAYWGVAMCSYHPLWTPPTASELSKGAKAIEVALSIPSKSIRERDYINAIALFYKNWDKTDHHTRTIDFKNAMEKLYKAYPGDKEAAIFYALALDAAADLADTTFINQKQAGAILMGLYPNEPNHPGIAHYIIHTYDYPPLASIALPIARKYASIAPSSAHALHMPSHIFTRLGLWNESIQSNLASTSSARCYAESSGIKGHWDEELHGMDYLVYAYLQQGKNSLAKEQWEYLKTIGEVYPINFKEAYAFASIPARYVLENKQWKEATKIKIYPADFPWNNFPWQKAIFNFARLLGFAHSGNLDSARAELKQLNIIYDTLIQQKDHYKANQVAIQIKSSEAWIKFKEGKNNEALRDMNLAADMEDRTEKHPVTPGEVLPARELLADMLLEMNQPKLALDAYQADLVKHPNRFNALYGAGIAAEKSGDAKTARFYYQELLKIAKPDASPRPEFAAMERFLQKQ